jgi:3-phosphoinositide dependent protein kinase-1
MRESMDASMDDATATRRGPPPATATTTADARVAGDANADANADANDDDDDDDDAPTTSASAPAPKLHLRMSDFTVLRDLGDGSFSEVLLVRRNATGTTHALKVMPKALLIREKKAAFAKHERCAMDACRDVPGVVRLQFTFQDAESLYMGMEACARGELFELIASFKPHGVPMRTTRFILAELLDVLMGVHARGVIHRDVKPENVLFDDRGHVMLTDFGSCLVLEDAASGGDGDGDGDAGDAGDAGEAGKGKSFFERELARRKAQFAFVGTCDYVPPEILSEPGGDEASGGCVDNLHVPAPPPAALDAWALGCVLYQCLVGTPPFRGANEARSSILHWFPYDRVGVVNAVP